MRFIKQKISADQYERYMGMTKAEQVAEIETSIPKDWFMGYGYYGFRLELDEEDGQCYIIHRLGDSCD